MTENYKYNATLYVSSQDHEELLKKITIIRTPDFSNMTAFELAYAAPNPLTGGKVGFETPVGGNYLIIPTLTPDEADQLTGFIYIVSQQNPPTKFFDITNFTPSTASLGAGESAAFFVAAQTVGTGFEFPEIFDETDPTATTTEQTSATTEQTSETTEQTSATTEQTSATTEQTSATTEQTSATTEQTSATTTGISSATTGDSTSTEQTTQTEITPSSTERASTESAPTESISTESTPTKSTITGQSTQISTSQSPESATTTPGTPETTPSSTTKATPVMNGIYHSLVSNFQPPGSNSIIRIYNGTDDNSQELYSNAATPNSTVSSIYLTVPFFKVSSSSQIYFSYQLTNESPPDDISVNMLPASGLISSNEFPNDGPSVYTKIEVKNAFYQWVNISVRGTFRPKSEASMLGEGFHSRVARQTPPVRDHLTLKWSVLNLQTGNVDPSQTITIEEYNETKFSYDFRGHILEINSAANDGVPGYTAQGAYSFEYLVYETDAPPSTQATQGTQGTQGTKPPPVTDASGRPVNPNTTTATPCPGFSYTSFDLIPILILGIFRLIL